MNARWTYQWEIRILMKLKECCCVYACKYIQAWRLGRTLLDLHPLGPAAVFPPADAMTQQQRHWKRLDLSRTEERGLLTPGCDE